MRDRELEEDIYAVAEMIHSGTLLADLGLAPETGAGAGAEAGEKEASDGDA